MLDLNEIQEVCKALDDRLGPQEWTVEGPDWRGLHSVYDGDGNRWFTGVEEKARFIARARTWLPALVEELREARAEIERLHILIESAAMTIGMVTTGQAQTLARRIEEAQE